MIIVLFLLLMTSSSLLKADWLYIPFDDAMKKHELSPYIYETTKKIIGIDGITLYNFFNDIYECHGLLRSSPQSILKIPKIIHQIWLGSPVPESLKQLQQSWIENHLNRG